MVAPESELFVVCLPGLESLLGEELDAMGIPSEPARGGVTVHGDQATIQAINLHSGLANHVLLRIAEFGARSLQDLDVRGARVDWTRWLPPATQVTVKARCRRSRIYHSGAAEERITKHLDEQLGAGTRAENHEPIAVRVRIQDNRCTLSLDTTGEPLHRRGWRHDPGPAPLREDLACALVRASGWDRTSPLLDPMMGSGTILIEAAGLALGLPPGRLRGFAFERFVDHDARAWRTLRDSFTPRGTAQLFGSDRDPDACERVRENATRAGVLDHLTLRTAPLSEATTDLDQDPGVGVIVTNPPYGKRLGDAQALIQLYRALGTLAKNHACRVALAAADRRLALRSGLKLESAFLADSGGLKIRGLRYAP